MAREKVAHGEQTLEGRGAPGHVTRRQFLEYMGASLALASTACVEPPREKILPYVRAPQGLIPGQALHYASAHVHRGIATGILIKTQMGRPVKVEGNPGHPTSLGGSNAQMQASILELYDPGRAQAISERGRIRTWQSFMASVGVKARALAEQSGRGIAIVTERLTSPTLGATIERLMFELPKSRWFRVDPCTRRMVDAGLALAFGRRGAAVYHLERPRVVLSLDADFTAQFTGAVRYARDFATTRRPSPIRPDMSRLFMLEPTPTPTGSLADHRLAVSPSRIEVMTRAIVGRVVGREDVLPLEAREALFVEQVVRALLAARGASVVVAGETQCAAVHALAHFLNAQLGNLGETVEILEPFDFDSRAESVEALSHALENSEIELLLVLSTNPVHGSPLDLDLERRFRNAETSVHLSRYADETSAACHWLIPEAHPFETWGDARGHDGTATIMQPVIAPLYGGRSPYELLAGLFEHAERGSANARVREHWRRTHGHDETFEAFWTRALHDGVVQGSAAGALPVAVVPRFFDDLPPPIVDGPSGLSIDIRPDFNLDDGRYSANAWLLELPEPITKLTWENAVLIGTRLAADRGLETGDLVSLGLHGQSVIGPALVVPGQAEDTVSVQLGWGRRKTGAVGQGRGFDVAPLRLSRTPFAASGLLLEALGRKVTLALAQAHFRMEGREIAKRVRLEDLRREGDASGRSRRAHERLSLYPERPSGEHAWAMSIDLSACTGCGACVVACQAENNIPVVGREQVIRSREMHWIRIDTYFEGDGDATEIRNQPVPCMHCEKAPCEAVCPVAATTHSPDGLNEMTYNRCVGTRYCENNCPYRVRRFNYYQYVDAATPALKAMRNPEVTVRSRGVMEKCTYCVQRISSARISAEREMRTIRDGEIVPACGQACPTQAIVFGDQHDPTARVSKEKQSARAYALLESLGVEPRTTYLASVQNTESEGEGI